MRNSYAADMTTGALFPKIIRFAVPLMLTSVLQQLYNTADIAVVGRFGSYLSVGAVGATASLINLILNFFIGISVGVGVSVAHARGAGDFERLSKTIHTAIPTAVISGLIITLVGVLFCDDFLKMMGTPGDIIALSTAYMRIYLGGAVSFFIYNFGASILRALGDTRRPLVFQLISGALNVFMNIIFVKYFHMDVAGVALATVLANTLSAALILLALTKREDECRLVPKEIKIHKEQFLRIFKIGLPAGVQSVFFSLSNVIIQSSVNSLGGVVVSGNAAAVSVENILWVINNSFSQAGMNFVGQNRGARKYDRIGKTAVIVLGSVAVVGVFFSSVALLFGRQILSVYLKDATDVIAYGLIRFRLVVTAYVFCGLMDSSTGLIRGLGYTAVPTVITFTGACLMRILWVFTVFKKYGTYESLIISMPVSWALSAAAGICAFFILKNYMAKKDNLQKENRGM